MGSFCGCLNSYYHGVLLWLDLFGCFFLAAVCSGAAMFLSGCTFMCCTYFYFCILFGVPNGSSEFFNLLLVVFDGFEVLQTTIDAMVRWLHNM